MVLLVGRFLFGGCGGQRRIGVRMGVEFVERVCIILCYCTYNKNIFKNPLTIIHSITNQLIPNKKQKKKEIRTGEKQITLTMPFIFTINYCDLFMNTDNRKNYIPFRPKTETFIDNLAGCI